MNGLDDLSLAIGALQASLTAVQKDLADVKILAQKSDKTLTEARGGGKSLLLAAGFAGTLGAIIGKALPWWGS